MPLTEKKKITNNNYIKKAYRPLNVKFRKEEPLFEILDNLQETTGISKAEFIKQAIYEKLERDNIYKLS